MKSPWILPATTLAIGAIAGFFTAKNVTKSEPAEASEAPVAQTRSTSNSRVSGGDGNSGGRRTSTRAGSVEDIYRTPGNLSRLEGLMRFYGGLDADALRAEAEKLDELPLNERMPASFLLFARWAELDPFGAMEYSNAMGMRGAFVRPTILQGWASVDPAGAAKYYASNPGQFAMMSMGRGMGGGMDAPSIIATEWARQDPQAALAWAGTLNQGKSDALAAVLGEVAKSDPQAAAQMLNQLAPEDRTAAYSTIAGRFGAQDFSAAQAWIRTLPQDQQADAMAAAFQGLASKSPEQALTQLGSMPEGEAKSRIIPTLVGPLARTNPAAAARLIGSLTDVEDQRDSVRELIPTWTAQDPAAALAFAQNQQSGPVYDRAMAAFVTSNHSGNPGEMMRLAETIENERERGWSVAVAAQRWMQSEPEAARQYITQSESIPEDMRERILEGRPMWGGRGRGRN